MKVIKEKHWSFWWKIIEKRKSSRKPENIHRCVKSERSKENIVNKIKPVMKDYCEESNSRPEITVQHTEQGP